MQGWDEGGGSWTLMQVGSLAFSCHCERSEAIHLTAQRKNGLLRYARNDGGESATLASPLLPRKERLERRHGFLGAHPFAEQMAFLVDPARHVLRRQFQQFSRDRDRLSRQRADLTGHLARLGLGM